MIITHFVASDNYGGLEKVSIDLCNEMSKENKVYLITFAEKTKLHGINDLVAVRTIKKFNRWNIIGYMKLIFLIKKIKTDIIHTHGGKASEIIYRVHKLLSCDFIATKHNARKGKIFNKIRHVTAVSKDAVSSIKSKNVSLIYNGINPKSIHDVAHHPKNLFTICAIGRLDKIKGFDVLIKQFALIEDDCILNIIGEGEEYKNLERLIYELNLEKKVFLKGFQDTIPEIMSESNLIVISSYTEGFSIVLIESLFYGNMILSTPVSGSKDILSNDFLCEQDEINIMITKIIHHYEIYKRKFYFIKKENCKHFLLEDIAKKYFTLYLKIKEESK